MSHTLRQLIRELRHIHQKGPVRDSPAYIYVLEQYHRYQLTGAKYCREKDEMKHIAETYLCYLESLHKQEELSAQYARGERSVAESANLVRLNLPKTYEPPLT
jgi:hypothetical protein